MHRIVARAKPLLVLALLSGWPTHGIADDFSPPATAAAPADAVIHAEEAHRDGLPLKAAPIPSQPAPRPYNDPFYKNDFSYLDSPEHISEDPLDALKRIRLGPCLTLDVGGEYRLRFHHEDNLRLNGLEDHFLLQRTRLYGDLHFGRLRGYAELIDAASAFESLPPRATDENRADFINLFGEAKLWEDCGAGSLSARVGRQELAYGAQRLISPLDWGNTRRTFDGAALFWNSSTWAVDTFWTRPIPFGQHVNNDHNLDNPDQSQQFYGVYATWQAFKDHTWDIYYLRLEESDLRSEVGAPLGRSNANTFGGRYQGRCRDWLCEAESGYQFGDFRTQDQSAGFYTVGLGYDFKCLPWKPVFWVYFDWASGDSDPNDDDRGTFNQLFPLGHKYLGFADLVGRQNIEDWNFLITAKPHDRVTLLAWWHIFHLEQARDSLYNAAGAAIRTDATGTSGTDVGQELDFTIQVQLTQHADVLFGYSRFFAGDFMATTGPGNDADFFYTQVSIKF